MNEGIELVEGFGLLARRVGFNVAVRHIKTALVLSAELEEGANFAELIEKDVTEGRIAKVQLAPLLNVLVCEKFGYRARTLNLPYQIEDVADLVSTVSQWDALNLVIAFYPVSAGIVVINPANARQWQQALPYLQRGGAAVCYAGAVRRGDVSDEILGSALDDLLSLLEGRKVKIKKGYTSPKGRGVERIEPAPRVTGPLRSPEASPSYQQAIPSTGQPVRVTNQYSVLVTNELFHNGNVEAWKKIIQSYKNKYPGNDVLVWYDGEKINDLNALFKWGKVKHGTPILISVSGPEIKDVAKLRKYLFEGASNRFEIFLRGAMNASLQLF